ncbi:Glycosyltransferase involved in cell wall bisynthesis [Pseudomonas sp. NFPP10]|uniref:glycosyltransferase n=1 Tax=Pseudomonas TaxID=286 RepID=UPI0008906AF4|nr:MULTISPECIES: glycosyltransferase [Pseudomonas]BCQ63751.1 glycosyl transferase family 1 [Pseudomonas sp. Boi14]MCU1767039.1 glycosyltransferase [Pseudomonas protegens]PNW00655.1 glycosyl transferase family 1 [Pseudomonas protegens]POA82403.1 glycosyl transferase family 1 [Pseudomonas protegens]SDA16795.1 Glycosyltransferase involved in cell wall bisynthesis [Pseudomonas sp. NFPP12]
MHIALLAPMPPEQNGIADYAAHLRAALEGLGLKVSTPLAGLGNDPQRAIERVAHSDWQGIDLVHAELGGGRLAEFHALKALRERFPSLPLSATVHDPERLVWRRASLPWPLSLATRLPSPLPQIATVLTDPLCLHEEKQLARSLTRLITLTHAGGACLRQRMGLRAEQMVVIPHGNLAIPARPLPPLTPLRLLYFGFIYRGKGIEDLLDALAMAFAQQPAMRERMRLTLAGGSEPEMAFGSAGSYLDQLRQHIQRLNLQDSIDWQLDLPATDIPKVIQAHHVMVLPYRESSKLKLLGTLRGTSGALSWAVACGRGAITSDARSFAEEVAQDNGVIFPQGNVAALAAELSHLCASPERVERWAEHAAVIGSRRVWSHTAERFARVFSDACGGPAHAYAT